MNSLVLFQALTDETLPRAGFGSFIRDAKCFSNSFLWLNLSHTKREGNRVAHNLARHSLHVLDLLVCTKDVSP